MSRFQVLSDAQWSMIADMLPRPTGRKGRPFADARTMVEAIYLPVSDRHRLARSARGLRSLADGLDLAPAHGR